MSDVVRADFARYYAEKLWELIPPVYRHEDGIADRPGTLWAFVELLAQQAALLRKSHDRLWEDQFIELCDDWAVPYLGDLVGTRLLSALNARGQRVDVAKTIYYRRRKGTVRLLEELISDITGWEGTLVENFRRLGRTRHGLDPKPLPFAGHFTRTLPGGLADLRIPRGGDLAGGPFDEFHYTPDMRQHNGSIGKYGIPKVAFHIFRLQAFLVDRVPAAAWQGDKRFSIDPSGRDVQLFMPRNRRQDPGPDDSRWQNWDNWRLAREWELPGPMRCGVMNDAEGGKKALLGDVQSMNAIRVEEAPGYFVSPDTIVAGDLSNWSSRARGKRLIIDPRLGRLLFVGPEPAGPVRVSYHYGFSGQIGAGSYDRQLFLGDAADVMRTPDKRLIKQTDGTYQREDILPGSGQSALTSRDMHDNGITELLDSSTYASVVDMDNLKNFNLRSANTKRPFINLAADWILTGADSDAQLVLEGIWIGSGKGYHLILRGTFNSVTIRHSTLDPGNSSKGQKRLEPAALHVEGAVKELIVDHSITGPIRIIGSVESFQIRDSIIQSIDDTLPVIEANSGLIKMNRVTVFGGMNLHRLQASEVLTAGTIDVADTQQGCFRFGAVMQGSILPRPFHSRIITEWKQYFVSRRFGDPGYAQLTQKAPEYIRRGAENGSEIGAWSSLLNPIKQDCLSKKVHEYMPFGLIPVFIQET